jgi:hypothetical protein
VLTVELFDELLDVIVSDLQLVPGFLQFFCGFTKTIGTRLITVNRSDKFGKLERKSESDIHVILNFIQSIIYLFFVFRK